MDVMTPVRVVHSYTQHLEAPPADVFPLLCPVREADWLSGWSPVVVFSESGVVEPGCVFRTRDGELDTYWMVVRHEPKHLRVEMVRITPDHTACHLHIQLRPDGKDKTLADVAYSWTALSGRGKRFVEDMDADAYATFMQQWEKALNHYLRTGERLPG